MEITVSHRGKSGGDYLHLDLPFLKLFLNVPGRQHLYKSNLPVEIMFSYLLEVVFLYIIHPLVIDMFLSMKCMIFKIIDFVITFASQNSEF